MTLGRSARHFIIERGTKRNAVFSAFRPDRTRVPCFYPHAKWAVCGPGACWGPIYPGPAAVRDLGLLGLPSNARSPGRALKRSHPNQSVALDPAPPSALWRLLLKLSRSLKGHTKAFIDDWLEKIVQGMDFERPQSVLLVSAEEDHRSQVLRRQGSQNFNPEIFVYTRSPCREKLKSGLSHPFWRIFSGIFDRGRIVSTAPQAIASLGIPNTTQVASS